MQNQVFQELENKIENMIEEVELLRMEIGELRDTKAELEAQTQEWESNLNRLLGKFKELEEGNNEHAA